MFAIPAILPDDPTALQQLLRAALAEIERQRLIIAALQRNRFGRRSEQLDDATVQQGVEDAEQSVAEQTAAVEAATPPLKPPATEAAPCPPRSESAKRNRGALPAELPRVEQVIDVETKACPCCGNALHLIGPRSGPMPRKAVSWPGEDRSEMLDYVPAHWRVRVIRRPRGACPCEGEGLPLLRRSDRAGAGAGTSDRRRHGDRGRGGAGAGQQIQRPSAAVPQMLRSTFAIKCCTADYVAETLAVP